MFSFASDVVLKRIGEIIKNSHDEFPLGAISEKFRSTSRDILFTDDSINNLLWSKYGSGETLIVMSVLYPWADLKNHFHIDHIHPKAKFTKNRLAKMEIEGERAEFFMGNFNHLGNLQLLEGVPNKEKSMSFFEDWIAEQYSDAEQRKDYMKKHYIPDVGFSFENFEEFFSEREKLLCTSLRKELI